MVFYEGCVLILLMLICVLLLKILRAMQQMQQQVIVAMNSAPVTDWLDGVLLFVEETRDFCQDLPICGNYVQFLSSPSDSAPLIDVSKESKEVLNDMHSAS